jgi:hypothetical protein
MYCVLRRQLKVLRQCSSSLPLTALPQRNKGRRSSEGRSNRVLLLYRFAFALVLLLLWLVDSKVVSTHCFEQQRDLDA